MNPISSGRAAILRLVIPLFTALVLAASAQARGPGHAEPGGGRGPQTPRGSAGVSATLTAVDATAGTIQVTDRNGFSATLKTSSSTVIRRDGKTATLADLKVNDTVVVVYDRQTLVASRIEATSPPPTVLTGTITALGTGNGTLQVVTDHDTAITLAINSTTQIRLNGSTTTAANLALGQTARVTYRPADKIALTIAAATPRTGIVSGAITALDSTAGTLTLTPLVGAAQTLKLNAQTEYRLNGRRVTAGTVVVGQLATVQVGTDSTAQIVAAQTPPLVDLLGSISALDVQGGSVTITTQAQTSIILRVGTFTTVRKNNAASTVDALAVGDQVQVRYEYLLIPGTSRALTIAATSATTTTPTPPSSSPAVASLTLSPATVTGGTASTATVTLTAAAPSSGAVVTLISSNPTVAVVPANVTVLAGATSASFTVTTTTVTAATPVTISASFGGVTSVATLTVNP